MEFKYTNIRLGRDLHLDVFCREDATALVNYLNEPEIARNTLKIPSPYTEKDAEEWLKMQEDALQELGYPRSYAIRNGKGALMGALGFASMKPREELDIELGYWLAAPFRKQGILSRVLEHFSNLCLTEWGFRSVTATIFAFNTASQKTAAKAGFRPTDYLKDHYNKNGEIFDGIRFTKTFDDVILARRVSVIGRVQGVFFRQSTQEKARELGLSGTVRNLQDGSVYIEVQGSARNMNLFLDWCKMGPPAAEVREIYIQEGTLWPYQGFETIRD